MLGYGYTIINFDLLWHLGWGGALPDPLHGHISTMISKISGGGTLRLYGKPGLIMWQKICVLLKVGHCCTQLVSLSSDTVTPP